MVVQEADQLTKSLTVALELQDKDPMVVLVAPYRLHTVVLEVVAVLVQSEGQAPDPMVVQVVQDFPQQSLELAGSTPQVVVVVVVSLERAVAPLEAQEEPRQLCTAPQVQLTRVLVVEETLPSGILALSVATVAPVS
jgi:hypothetical protein